MRIYIAMACISTSALLYCAALFIPSYCWWGMFIFLLPLYYLYLSLNYQVYARHGFWWGTLVFGSLTYCMGRTSTYYAQLTLHNYHTVIVTIILMITITLYCACYSALWFWIIGTYIKYKKFTKNSPGIVLLLTLITTIGYITCIDRWCFWPFLRLEGYPLLHPLIALSEYPALLSLLPYVGKHALTVVLLAPGTALFYRWHRRSLRSLLIVACTVMPWIISYVIRPTEQNTPQWLSTIAWLPMQGTGTSALALIVQQTFKAIVSRHSTIQTIILPESAFCTNRLCSDISCTRLWDSLHLGKPLTVVCGSFSTVLPDQSACASPGYITTLSQHSSYCYNTCFVIYDGIITHRFHKKHTMAFFEQLPSWITGTIYDGLRAILFSNTPPIMASANTRVPLPINETTLCIPYICSELFFSQYTNDYFSNNRDNYPIMALISDNWTQSKIIHDSMFRLAQFKAIEWRRDILYISYTRAAYINKNGIYQSLPAYSTL